MKHRLATDTAQGEGGALGHAEEASGTFRTSFLPATTLPQAPAGMMLSGQRGGAAPAEESRGRAAAVRHEEMRACLNNGNAVLDGGQVLPPCQTVYPRILPHWLFLIII